MTGNNSGGISQLLRSLKFALSVHNLSSSLSLSFSLSRHRPLHRVRQLNIPDFHHAYLYAPWLCSFINQRLELIINLVPMSQQVFKFRLAHYVS